LLPWDDNLLTFFSLSLNLLLPSQASDVNVRSQRILNIWRLCCHCITGDL
jgi:hypothetical protein